MFDDDIAKLSINRALVPSTVAMQFFNERYHDYLTLVALDQNAELSHQATFLIQLYSLKRGCKR